MNDIGGNSVLGGPSLLVSGVCMENQTYTQAVGYYVEELKLKNMNKYTEVLVVIVFFFFH